ncbi:MAG: AMP-binding protein [Burkholderiaceae bacterium]
MAGAPRAAGAGHGMTETSPGVAMLGADDAARKVGSAGKALLHAEVRIVDADGHDVGPNQMGELWTRGPHITPGYWNKPEATEAAFEGRWLKTGDAAQFDDEGFIYIVDRWKDMYISRRRERVSGRGRERHLPVAADRRGRP